MHRDGVLPTASPRVDREEAAAADRVGRAERECRGGDGRDGGERPDRLRNACEDPHRRYSEHDADEEAEADLAHDEQDEVVDAVRARVLDPRDQAKRERDRHRVVAAGLRLESSGEPAAHPGFPKRGEHGSRIRRGDDGAEQNRLEP